MQLYEPKLATPYPKNERKVALKKNEISDSYSGKHNLEMRNLGVSIRNVTIKSDSVTDWLTGYLSAGLVNILPGNYLIGARFSTMLYFSILR